MKITSIDLLSLKLQTAGERSELGTDAPPELQQAAGPETIAAQRYTPPETVLVRIRTDANIEGIGEGATLPHYLGHGIGSLIDWLIRFRKVLIGCNPLDIAAIHREMEMVAGIGVPGCRPAQAAIDMAVHDIAGKAYRCPVFELLGGAYRTTFDLQTQMHGHTVEQQIAVCEHYLARGFRALKIKIGGSLRRDGYSKGAVDLEAEKVAAVAAKIPHDIQLDVDANQALRSAKISIGLFERVLRSAYHPNMAVEQPLHHLDLIGHALIRRALPLPIILDEAITSPEAMLQVVRHEAADRIVLKPNRVGGLWPARKIINICEANSIGISLDTMPFTLLGDTMLCHLGATIRNAYAIDAEGHTYFAGTPFSKGVTLENGTASISRQSGFGVEVDEILLSRVLVEDRSTVTSALP